MYNIYNIFILYVYKIKSQRPGTVAHIVIPIQFQGRKGELLYTLHPFLPSSIVCRKYLLKIDQLSHL